MRQPSDTQTMTDIFNNLRRVFQALNEQSKQVEKLTSLTGPQLWAIQTIARESPVRVSVLAEKMFLHPATVVGILNRLEARGLIVRNRTKRDRRVVEIELTESGRTFAVGAPEVPQGKLATGLTSLSASETAEIHRSLQRLVSILDAQDMKPAPIAAPTP